MNYKTILPNAFLVFMLTTMCQANDSDPLWTTFGEGRDRELNANCFLMSYPSTFSVHPESGILHSSTPKEKDAELPKEGNLHTLILHNEDETLLVRASSFGFLTKDFYIPRGFKSPREVIFVDYFRNAMTMKIINKKGFDIFYSETDEKVSVIFFNPDADWGSCFQSLSFTFLNSTSMDDHEDVIEEMISNFVPSFARKRE